MSEAIKILLIEDDEVDRMFFQRTLKATGIGAELILAEDAAVGLKEAGAQNFDCVFLDYMLPGTDGLEVLNKLRAAYKSSVVLVTSHGDEKIAVEAMKAGALDYISKNLITPESLSQIIRNILRLHNAEKEKTAIEEAFRQSEKRYRIFFEKSQGFFCTHDVEGNFITVNHSGAQSIGYTSEDLIGVSLKKILSQNTQHFFDTYLEHILKEKSASGLMRVVTKHGEERIWSYNNSLYEEPNETYIIGSVQDITDRVKMEEERLNAIRLAEESAEIKKLADKIKESINYAKRLQDGIYISVDVFKKVFQNSFIIDYPKEIVSGDFYWLDVKDKKIILAVADCTGHGVPGALLSTLGYTMLNNIVLNNSYTSPDQILKKLGSDWGKTFDYKSKQINNHDGMEIAVCSIDYENKVLEFSGMGGSMFFVKNGELTEYRGENTGISSNDLKVFNDYGKTDPVCHKIPFEENDCIYLFSDGYRDQFGGPGRNDKFTKRRFKNLIADVQKYPMEKQRQLVDDAFKEWKGSNSQIDDVLVIGVQL